MFYLVYFCGCPLFYGCLSKYWFLFIYLQVSASDPDCGVNAIVNYTLGDGFKKMMEFDVEHTTGDICISGTLDFETRSSYEFPIIATDQGNFPFNESTFYNCDKPISLTVLSMRHSSHM